MPVRFEYALVEINGKPVLVDQTTFDQASEAFRDALAKIEEITHEIREAGFALQTPEGMRPVVLGSLTDFTGWVSRQLGIENFSLENEAGNLPDPFGSGLQGLVRTDLVLYSASLFYTAQALESSKKKTKTNDVKRFYGELVIGFRIPPDFMQSFPLRLREVVLAVNNYPAPADGDG